jgi:hypothetical protein
MQVLQQIGFMPKMIYFNFNSVDSAIVNPLGPSERWLMGVLNWDPRFYIQVDPSIYREGDSSHALCVRAPRRIAWPGSAWLPALMPLMDLVRLNDMCAKRCRALAVDDLHRSDDEHHGGQRRRAARLRKRFPETVRAPTGSGRRFGHVQLRGHAKDTGEHACRSHGSPGGP